MPADRQVLTVCVKSRIPVMLAVKVTEMNIMDNPTPETTPITVEFGGSGEQISLEFSHALPALQTKNLWKSALPVSARMVEESSERENITLHFSMSMSGEPGDWTTVNVSFEEQSESSTRIQLTHSYLIDESECRDMKTFWNHFATQVGLPR